VAAGDMALTLYSAHRVTLLPDALVLELRGLPLRLAGLPMVGDRTFMRCRADASAATVECHAAVDRERTSDE
jgi:hypothetical protein